MIEEDFSNIINGAKNAYKTIEFDVDTNGYKIQKDLMTPPAGESINHTSAPDFFNALKTSIGSKDRLNKLNVDKGTDRPAPTIDFMDLTHSLSEDKKMIGAINPYLNDDSLLIWRKWLGTRFDKQKYTGQLLDAKDSIKGLTPKLDFYQDIMDKKLEAESGLRKAMSTAPEFATPSVDIDPSGMGGGSNMSETTMTKANYRYELDKLNIIKQRKRIIDGLIELRPLQHGYIDLATEDELLKIYTGRDPNILMTPEDANIRKYGNNIQNLIDLGILPEEILDKGWEDGIKLGAKRALVGLATSVAVGLAIPTGGSSLALLAAGLGGGAVGSIAFEAANNYMEEKKLQELLNSNDPENFKKGKILEALSKNQAYARTKETVANMTESVGVVAEAAPGIASFLARKGSKLFSKVGPAGRVGAAMPNKLNTNILDDISMAGDGTTASAKESVADIQASGKGNTADILTARGGTRIVPTVDDIMNLQPRLGDELSKAFSEKVTQDTIFQQIRDIMHMVGIDPSQVDQAFGASFRIDIPGIRGGLAKRLKTGGTDIFIGEHSTMGMLFHEMIHGMVNQLRNTDAGKLALDKYYRQVTDMFEYNRGNNLSVLFDAWSKITKKTYDYEDILHGKYYKNSLIRRLIRDPQKRKQLQESIEGGYFEHLDPSISTMEDLDKFTARTNQPNPLDFRLDHYANARNRILEVLGASPDDIHSLGRMGQDEFLTEMMQRANMLDATQRLALDQMTHELFEPLGRSVPDSLTQSLQVPLQQYPKPKLGKKRSKKRSTQPRPNKAKTTKSTTSNSTQPTDTFSGPTPQAPPPYPARRSILNLIPSSETLLGTGKGWKEFVKTWSNRATAVSTYATLGSLGLAGIAGLTSGLFGTEAVPPEMLPPGPVPPSATPTPSTPPTTPPLPEVPVEPEVAAADLARRMFETTDVAATGAFESRDKKYNFGQVKNATSLGLKDPLNVTNFRVRKVKIPTNEVGMNAGNISDNFTELFLYNHPLDTSKLNPLKTFTDKSFVYGSESDQSKDIINDTNKDIQIYLKKFFPDAGDINSTNIDNLIKDFDPNTLQRRFFFDRAFWANPGTIVYDLKKIPNAYVNPDLMSDSDWAAKFGLWDINKETTEDGANNRFGVTYAKFFLQRVKKALSSQASQVAQDQYQSPKTKDNYEKAIQFIKNYTGQMDRDIYSKINPGFASLNIAKPNSGKPEDYAKTINQQVNKWRQDNIDKAFGGIPNTDLDRWTRAKDKYNIGGNPEDVRATVLSDVNTLHRAKALDTFIINSNYTPGNILELTKAANVIAGSNTAMGASITGFMDSKGQPLSEDMTLVDFIKDTLSFTKNMNYTDRQSRLDMISNKVPSLGGDLGGLKETYSLWDSLNNYWASLAQQKLYTSLIDSSGQLESKDYDFAGGKPVDTTLGYDVNNREYTESIPNPLDFVKSYTSLFDTTKDQYNRIRTVLGYLKQTDIQTAETPFNNAAFVASKKEQQMQDTSTAPIDPITRARGGMVYASSGMLVNYQPRGTDTIPAMLTPGEFVVNRAATQKNLPLLQSINSGVSYASSGGIINPIYRADGGNGIMGSIQSISKSIGLDMSSASSVFDTFIKSFNTETNNLGSLINNLAKVFPALGGPVSAFGNHVDKLVKALNDIKTIEIKGPNIPDTIRINSDTIRVELIAPENTNYKLSDEDKKTITNSLTTSLRSLTTMGRIVS